MSDSGVLKTVHMIRMMMKQTINSSNNIRWNNDDRKTKFDFNIPPLDDTCSNPYDPILSDEEMSPSPNFYEYYAGRKTYNTESQVYTNLRLQLQIADDLDQFNIDNSDLLGYLDTDSVSSLESILEREDPHPSPVSPRIIKEEEEEQLSPTSLTESSDDEIPPRFRTYPMGRQPIIPKRKMGGKLKKRRRKRKNLLKPGSQLYQFILQLLDDRNIQNEIAWVQQDKGIFRILQKEAVAKRWGDFKERDMTYDSLSRALRHYYQQGLLNSVNKKLHYQFTQKALEEWEEIRDKDLIDDTR